MVDAARILKMKHTQWRDKMKEHSSDSLLVKDEDNPGISIGETRPTLESNANLWLNNAIKNTFKQEGYDNVEVMTLGLVNNTNGINMMQATIAYIDIDKLEKAPPLSVEELEIAYHKKMEGEKICDWSDLPKKICSHCKSKDENDGSR